MALSFGIEGITPEEFEKASPKALQELVQERAGAAYEEKEKEFPEEEQIREVERVILLKVIDLKWLDHIDDMEQLRQGICLQSYAQKDPLVE